MVRPKSKIPDRWEDYSPIGRRIPDTRFICCKCPLKEELCRKLPSKEMWFTPEYLLHLMAKCNSQLGLIIDLTNTDRYYNPQALTYSGVEYKKIFTPGHDVPTGQATDLFREMIEKYEKKYSNKEFLIAVHCTHGVNRTGYQVCHYLIETLGWSFEKAVQSFNHARGHSIERENYLEALKQLEKNRSKNSGKDGRSKRKRHHRQTPSPSSSSSSSSVDGKQRHRPIIGPLMNNSKNQAKRPTSVDQISVASMTQPPPPPPAHPVAPAAPPMMQQQFNIMQHLMMGMVQMQAMMTQYRPPIAAPPVGAIAIPPPPPPAEPAAAATSSSSKKNVQKRKRSRSSVSSSSSSSDEEDGEGSPETSEDVKSDSDASVGEKKSDEKEHPADWEMGGKVEGKPTTDSKRRRIRKKRLQHMHRTMKRGKFWEIREMQKEHYGF